MARLKGRGWHGDPEGHADAARARDKFNWWPLLLVPLAFIIGVVSNDLMNNGRIQDRSQILRGVGGGGTVCTSPSPSVNR